MKVGVVGLGMGRNHVLGFQQTPGVTVEAICDVDAGKLQAAAAQLGVKRTFTDAQEMFATAGLDAVSIAVPNVYHHGLTLKALAAGLHVLCEKPLAMNAQQAGEMRDAAVAARRTLMVNYTFRYKPASFAIKQAIDAGELGQLYFARSVWHRRDGIPSWGGWFSRKELSGGGPVIDLGVHRLDLALWFMGYPPVERVSAATYSHLGQAKAAGSGSPYTVEDLGVGYIRLQGGATIVLEASWALNRPERDLMETWVYGTAGGAVQRNVGESHGFDAEIYLARDNGFYTRRLEPNTLVVPTPWGEFHAAVRDGRQPLSSADDGVKTLQVLDAFYRSAAAGKEVKVDQ